MKTTSCLKRFAALHLTMMQQQALNRASSKRRTNLHRLSTIFPALALIAFSANVFAQASLTSNRTRLLDTYAERIAASSGCEAWGQMTTVQKGVFLTITDLLGKRSFIGNTAYAFEKTSHDGCDPGGTDCTVGCWIPANPDDPATECTYVSPEYCEAQGRCVRTVIPRTDFSTALDHVTRIWAVRDSSSCGGQGNRIFFSADDTLMNVIRNFYFGLPEWAGSEDLAGPHWPFNNTSETRSGQPRGQMHFWSWDFQAQTLWDVGVEGVYDPHIVGDSVGSCGN